MKNTFILISLAFLTALFCLASFHSRAQKHEPLQDSMKQAAIDDSIHLKALSDTVVPKIVNKIETYTFTLSRSSNYFSRRIDTTKVSSELPEIEKRLTFFKNRLDKNEEMNLRNLSTFTILLQESTSKLDDWQKTLNDYAKHLASSNLEVRKIIEDAALKTKLPDTALSKQVQAVLKKAIKLDSMQHTAMMRINVMKNKVSINSLLVSDMLSDLNFRTTSLKVAIWGKEDKPIYKARAGDYKQSLWDVMTQTVNRSLRVWVIYTYLTWDTRSLNFIILTVMLLVLILNYRAHTQI